jgi:hypothetical protein
VPASFRVLDYSQWVEIKKVLKPFLNFELKFQRLEERKFLKESAERVSAD